LDKPEDRDEVSATNSSEHKNGLLIFLFRLSSPDALDAY
jgi:hypothetical protein